MAWIWSFVANECHLSLISSANDSADGVLPSFTLFKKERIVWRSSFSSPMFDSK